MFRSFCAGAIAGFLFGSTKKGQDVREGLDGFLTELTSGDAIKALDDKRNELSELASSAFSKITGGEDKKLAAQAEEEVDEKEEADEEEVDEEEADEEEDTDEQNFEPELEKKEDALDLSQPGKPLDADKAQELADKLGAKPSAPEDENLAAFHHDDELKSA